jgi:alkylation response protein AidB-like acyl-CoA dehydrogenase
MSGAEAMDIETIDPEELRDAAARLLGDLVARRAPYDPGKTADRAGLFAAMAEQGWLLLTVPAEMDGLGQSFAALAPIYEEMGKAIAPVVLAPSIATLELLAHNPTDALTDLAVAIAGGEARVAVATDPKGVTVSGGKLSGTFGGVLADEDSTHLLVLGDDGQAWLVDLVADGVSVETVDSWDRSRILFNIALDGAAGNAALAAPDPAATDRVRGHLDLAIAWDCVGGTARLLDETLEYLRTRKQFDRAIGSFQALKHRAADHKVELEVARAAARGATTALAGGRDGAVAQAGGARLIAEQAYRYMAEDGVQLHGGIGFTWEHDCHLFLKRAILNELLYGRASERRDRIAPAMIARMAQSQA